jgi:hypothetical protein
VLTLNYDRARVECAAAARILGQIGELLNGMAAGAAGHRVRGVPLLPLAERWQLMEE